MLPNDPVLAHDRTYWLFADGTVIPRVSGGDGSEGDGSGDAGGGAGEGDAAAGAGAGADGAGGESQLGDAGKRALDAEREARRAADARAKELEDKLAKFEDANKSETERAIEKARKDADEAARAEVTTAYEMRLVKADVRTRAAGKLADPGDAVQFLDLDELAKSEEGPDRDKAIDAAIAELVKSKPYLATGAKPAGPGDPDGGPRGAGPTQLTREQLKNMTPEQIMEAREKGQLKNLLGAST